MFHRITIVMFVLFLNQAAGAVEFGESLVGYWKLAGDCRDCSGRENHGVNHGVDFYDTGRDGNIGTAGHFNGTDAYIEVPDCDTLDLGSSDFTPSVWIQTEEKLRDTLGDIVGKFNPTTRKGFNFLLLNWAGVASGQSNYRNVFFGIDDARIDSEWTDCGRPGNAILAFALTVYRGELYAGTFEWAADQAGHVYRYAGGKEWIDCGTPDKSTAVFTLAVYQDKLYAGTSRYDGMGSSLKQGPSPNTNPGGRIYRYEGGREWTDCGRLENEQTGQAGTVHCLTVFDGGLYATPWTQPGKGLYRYEGNRDWSYRGTYLDKRVNHTSVYNGCIYGVSYDAGGDVCRYHGGRCFTSGGILNDVGQGYAFMVYQGRLHISSWPNAEVFRHNGETDWTSCGRLGMGEKSKRSSGEFAPHELEAMGMAVYNGKLYVGSLPLARVYRCDDGYQWTNTGQIDTTPEEDLRETFPMRRAWTMAVYQGRLFCSGLPSGIIRSIEAGKSVTYDYELASGWRHLAAVRCGRTLKLYIDGKPAASSSEFNPGDYDISNDTPLKIGFGQHDYFNGYMSELRIYKRALQEAELLQLYRSQI